MVASPAAAIADTHRLFFAILPPLDVAACIGGQRETFGELPSPVADHRLHITIGISKDHPALPGALIDTAIGAADTVGADPFRVVFDQAIGNMGSIALRPNEALPGLITFRRRLSTALAAAGFEQRSGWRFNPHVTLGYRDGAPCAAPILPISWTVNEFVLVHSHIGVTRHDILARRPLRKS